MKSCAAAKLLAGIFISLLFAFQQDKKVMISVLIILWNIAFIVGFLPLVGWNSVDNSCVFFHFYSSSFLFFLSACVLVSMAACVTYQLWIGRTLRLQQVRHRSSFTDETRLHHGSVARMTVTLARFDLLLNILFYVPVLIFFMLHCSACVLYKDTRKESRMVLFFYPLVQVKGIFAVFVHALTTPQISDMIKNVSRKGLSGIQGDNQGYSQTSASTILDSSTGTLGIFTIGRRYSLSLKRVATPRENGAHLPVSSSQLALGSSIERPPGGVCPSCGRRRDISTTASNQHLPAESKSTVNNDVSGRAEQTPLDPNSLQGHRTVAVGEAAGDVFGHQLSDSGAYRGSFARTHLFRPQYWSVDPGEAAHRTYYPVPRDQLWASESFCPVHGARFTTQRPAVTSDHSRSASDVRFEQIDEEPEMSESSTNL